MACYGQQFSEKQRLFFVIKGQQTQKKNILNSELVFTFSSWKLNLEKYSNLTWVNFVFLLFRLFPLSCIHKMKEGLLIYFIPKSVVMLNICWQQAVISLCKYKWKSNLFFLCFLRFLLPNKVIIRNMANYFIISYSYTSVTIYNSYHWPLSSL